MEARDRHIRDWLSEIRTARLALPRFQRKESWDNSTREDFLSSVVRGLPVGATLILQSDGEPHFESRFLSGAPEGNGRLREQLLDGQQRLTTLWKAFTDTYDSRTYLLSLEDENEPEVIGKKRYTKEGNNKLYPLWIDDPEECWKRDMVPLHVMNPDEDTSRQLREWCNDATTDDDGRDNLFDQLLPIEQGISRFNIPYLFLPPETEPEVAIDVFIKLNTSFVQLSIFDIIVAQTEEATGESLHQRMDELITKCPLIEEYTDPEKYVLRMEALRQDNMPTEKGFYNLDLERMVQGWETVIQGTEDLISFLEEEMIYDDDRLPTDVVLAPMAALFTSTPSDPDERGNARRIVKKYMWRSFFTDRYERSTGSRTQEDYRALKGVISGDLSEEEVPCFDENEHPLPSTDELKQTRWPKYKDRIARGLLILSFKGGAKNFADDQSISRRNISEREYHHLYPKAYLEENGFDEEAANTALNCALINWADNRTIGSKPPVQYLLDRSEAAHLGEDQIRRRLSSHLIEYDNLASENYESFLDNRAKTMKNSIENLCQGKEYNSN